MSTTFVEASKENWVSSNGLNPSNEQLQLGCLQRIAAATELMSKNYQSLFDELQRYKRYYNEERQVSQRMARTISSLKGHITRLKKQLI